MDKNNHTLTPKKWQQEALDAWVKGLCKGTIKAPTGTGKSYLAILGHHHLNNPLTLIITPTIILKEQWEKDLKESGINADVMVINGVRDNPQILTKYLFIVLDEIHHYASDQSQTIFKYMYHHFIMGLSATPERKDEQHEIFLEHAPIVYTYHITDAIEHNDIAHFEIIEVDVQLNPITASRLQRVDEFIRENMQRFQNDLSRVVAILAKSGWQNKREAGRLMGAIQTRKQMLFDCDEKNEEAVQLVQSHPGERVIIFTEVISSAEKIYSKLISSGRFAILYHSSIKKKERESAIALFEKFPTSVLVSVKATDEGVNVPSVGIGIMVSGTSVDRQFIQRLGRILRPQPGKVALLYHIFVADSKDEQWAKMRMREIKKEMRNNL